MRSSFGTFVHDLPGPDRIAGVEVTARLAVHPEQLLPAHDGKRSVERVQLGDLDIRGVLVGPAIVIGIRDVRGRLFAGFPPCWSSGAQSRLAARH
jgi:hypothetical protein